MPEREHNEQRKAQIEMLKKKLFQNHKDNLLNWLTISDETVDEIKKIIREIFGLDKDAKITLATYSGAALSETVFTNQEGEQQIGSKIEISLEDLNEKYKNIAEFSATTNIEKTFDEEPAKNDALNQMIKLLESTQKDGDSEQIAKLKDRLLNGSHDLKFLDCITVGGSNVIIYLETNGDDELYMFNNGALTKLEIKPDDQVYRLTTARRDGKKRIIFTSPNNELYLVHYAYAFVNGITSVKKWNGEDKDKNESWKEEAGDRVMQAGFYQKK